MDVVAVDLEAGGGTSRAKCEAIIDIRIRQREIVTVPCECPACIVAGYMCNRKVVGVKPIDAVLRRLRNCQIGWGGAYIEVRYRKVLDNAACATGRIDRPAVLRVAAT